MRKGLWAQDTRVTRETHAGLVQRRCELRNLLSSWKWWKLFTKINWTAHSTSKRLRLQTRKSDKRKLPSVLDKMPLIVKWRFWLSHDCRNLETRRFPSKTFHRFPWRFTKQRRLFTAMEHALSTNSSGSTFGQFHLWWNHKKSSWTGDENPKMNSCVHWNLNFLSHGHEWAVFNTCFSDSTSTNNHFSLSAMVIDWLFLLFRIFHVTW